MSYVVLHVREPLPRKCSNCSNPRSSCSAGHVSMTPRQVLLWPIPRLPQPAPPIYDRSGLLVHACMQVSSRRSVRASCHTSSPIRRWSLLLPASKASASSVDCCALRLSFLQPLVGLVAAISMTFPSSTVSQHSHYERHSTSAMSHLPGGLKPRLKLLHVSTFCIMLACRRQVGGAHDHMPGASGRSCVPAAE